MINTAFLIEHLGEIVVYGGAIVVPIGMAIKIKLDKVTSYRREYYPTVENYIKNFKRHQNKITEDLKQKNNKKGF